jgi:hypothetical protein
MWRHITGVEQPAEKKIFISKWEIWKICNKVKYNQSRIGDQTIFNTWKNYFKKHLQCTLQTSHKNHN